MDIPKGTRKLDYRLKEGDTVGVCTVGENRGRLVVVSQDSSAEVLLPQVRIFDDALQTQRSEVRIVLEDGQDLSNRSIENMASILVDKIIKEHGADIHAGLLAALNSGSCYPDRSSFPAPSFLSFNGYTSKGSGGPYENCKITEDMADKIQRREAWIKSLEETSSKLLTERMFSALALDNLGLEPSDFKISLLLCARPDNLKSIIIVLCTMDTPKILRLGWSAEGADVTFITDKRRRAKDKERREAEGN